MSKFYANNLRLQDGNLGTISGASSTRDGKEPTVPAWVPESRNSTDILIKPLKPRFFAQVGKRNKDSFFTYHIWILSIILSLSKTPPCLYYKTQHFGEWILPSSLGKTYSVGSNQ
jgi:hypothetical protein